MTLSASDQPISPEGESTSSGQPEIHPPESGDAGGMLYLPGSTPEPESSETARPVVDFSKLHLPQIDPADFAHSTELERAVNLHDETHMIPAAEEAQYPAAEGEISGALDAQPPEGAPAHLPEIDPASLAQLVQTEIETDQLGEAEAQAVAGAEVPGLSARQRQLLGRFRALSEAIKLFPESPANYVLRGELLVEGGEFERAIHDFTKALTLIEAQAETANWGYIYQTFAERAQAGLRQCRG